jgi:hypothetical protein
VLVTLLLSTHWTVVQGRIFIPWAVTVNGGKPPVPAGAEFGVIEVRVGFGNPPAGVTSVIGNEADVPSKFDTVTAAVPGSKARAAGMEAVSCVALTKVVALANFAVLFDTGTPFQFTSASLVKFVPFTVSVKS